MTKPPESSPWVSALGSTAIGLPIGVGIAVLGMKWGGWLLNMVLKNEVVGLVTFGGYFFVLGVMGLQGLCSDTQTTARLLSVASVPKWMFTVAGTLMGFAVGALCKNSGMYSAGFLVYAAIFLGAGWLFQNFQIEIEKAKPDSDRTTQRNVVLLSSLSLVLGTVSLVYAWCLACSCGVNL